MSRKGKYGEKYSFHVSNLVFECGRDDSALGIHGTLTTQGIDGAQPRKFTAQRTRLGPHDDQGISNELSKYGWPSSSSPGVSKRRPPMHPRNPLEPRYILPQCHNPPLPDPPKFIRNTLDVSDIAGAAKKEPRPARRIGDPLRRDPNVDCAAPGQDHGKSNGSTRIRHSGAPRTTALDVSDITGPRAPGGRAAARMQRSNEVGSGAPGSGRHLIGHGVDDLSVGKQQSVEW